MLDEGAPACARTEGTSAGRAVPEGTRHALQAACGAFAAGIGASGHALFLTAHRPRGTALVVRLRHAFPEIAGAAADLFARRAVQSSKPFWWSAAEGRAAAPQRWADRLPVPPAGGDGVAFPVSAASGEAGIVAFAADSVSIPGHRLADIHAGCFRLFEAAVGQHAPTACRRASVSPRELECLRLAADGYTSEEIAASLSLSVHTANQHLTSAAQKLDASGRMHAVAKALRMGLIE
jgi:DNA-binding CsgD family transcriptional regulator